MEMVSMSRLKMEKLNGTNFELWKFRMEDILEDRDLWIAVFGTKPTNMKEEEWVVLERMARNLIRIYLVDSVLLKFSEKKIATTLWKNLGDLYQAIYMVNKHFLWKRLFPLRMDIVDFADEHLNAFDTIVTQLILIGVKMNDEDHPLFFSKFKLGNDH
jgi:hypothetical protein